MHAERRGSFVLQQKITILPAAAQLARAGNMAGKTALGAGQPVFLFEKVYKSACKDGAE